VCMWYRDSWTNGRDGSDPVVLCCIAFPSGTGFFLKPGRSCRLLMLFRACSSAYFRLKFRVISSLESPPSATEGRGSGPHAG